MKRILSFAILAVSLTSLSAWGIRVIGGGGGLGEMQIESIFTRLRVLSQVCLQPNANCGLSRDERKALKLLTDSSLLDTKDAKIEFFYEPSSHTLFRYRIDNSDYVAISGNALYVRDGEPKSAGELAAIAFQAWTKRDLVRTALVEAGLEQVQMDELANKIFGKSRLDTQSLEMNHQILMHRFNLKVDELYAGAFLFMEQQGKTTDVTSQVLAKACRGRPSRLLRVVRMARQGAALNARIEWECGGNYMEGAAVIIPVLNSENIQLTLNSMRVIPPQSCEKYVK